MFANESKIEHFSFHILASIESTTVYNFHVEMFYATSLNLQVKNVLARISKLYLNYWLFDSNESDIFASYVCSSNLILCIVKLLSDDFSSIFPTRHRELCELLMLMIRLEYKKSKMTRKMCISRFARWDFLGMFEMTEMQFWWKRINPKANKIK